MTMKLSDIVKAKPAAAATAETTTTASEKGAKVSRNTEQAHQRMVAQAQALLKSPVIQNSLSLLSNTNLPIDAFMKVQSAFGKIADAMMPVTSFIANHNKGMNTDLDPKALQALKDIVAKLSKNPELPRLMELSKSF